MLLAAQVCLAHQGEDLCNLRNFFPTRLIRMNKKNSTHWRKLIYEPQIKDTRVTTGRWSLGHLEHLFSASPQKGPRYLHSMWKRKAFLMAVQKTALSILSQSPQHAEPSLASTIILDLGRRTPAKSEMCHEASG